MEEGGATGVGLPAGGETVPAGFLSVTLFSDSLKVRRLSNELDKTLNLNAPVCVRVLTPHHSGNTG